MEGCDSVILSWQFNTIEGSGPSTTQASSESKNIMNNILCKNPKEWRPCLAHKLTCSYRAKDWWTSNLQNEWRCMFCDKGRYQTQSNEADCIHLEHWNQTQRIVHSTSQIQHNIMIFIFLMLFLILFNVYNCIVPLGFLPWEIWGAFPGESQLQQNCAKTQSIVHSTSQ